MRNQIMKRFEYNHLDEREKAIAVKFYQMAVLMNNNLPQCEEKTKGLEKLIEARESFILASLLNWR